MWPLCEDVIDIREDIVYLSGVVRLSMEHLNVCVLSEKFSTSFLTNCNTMYMYVIPGFQISSCFKAYHWLCSQPI